MDPRFSITIESQNMAARFRSCNAMIVVVGSSDALAQGVTTEAAVRGMAVPARLGVMGFGDLDFAAHTSPSISSVHIDKKAIGIMAARALLARIDGKAQEQHVIDVGFRLVERDSTATPLPATAPGMP